MCNGVPSHPPSRPRFSPNTTSQVIGSAPEPSSLPWPILRRVWCYFYVPQPVLVKLSYGQKVNATLPEMKGKTFQGVITHINDEAEFTPKNVQTEQERIRLVYAAVKITFDNSEGLLKPRG